VSRLDEETLLQLFTVTGTHSLINSNSDRTHASTSLASRHQYVLFHHNTKLFLLHMMFIVTMNVDKTINAFTNNF